MIEYVEITDLSDSRLDIYARLTEAQLAQTPGPKDGLFIAESPNVIARALEGGCKPVSILVEKSLLKGPAMEIIEACQVPVFVGENSLLAKLTGYKLTRGLLCAMERPAPMDAGAILQNARRVAVLEDVVNPTNLGAIFRSAAALGMDGVILTRGCSDPLYRRSARVSMGTVFQIPWAWWDRPIAYLKEYGFATAAMALSDNSLSVDDPALKAENRLAIVLGTEGEGLQESTIKSCDYTVKIPMYHGVDSLNVAAASAVAFYALKASLV